MENKSEFRTLHRVFLALSFLIILIIHSITAQPSVPFWDCGEFLSMMTWQQVPHPPGAPLFSILGGVVQTLIPFGNLGWQGNMMSVVSSALTIAVLYLMIVIVIKNLRDKPIETIGDALAVYGAAFVGSLAFGFSGTFWFNAVESEVYAMATLNVVIVLYLLMRWTQVADEEDNERYLLLSVYITGLSMGIHLLSMLVLFTIVLVVYFRKYEVTTKSFLIMAGIGLASFYVVIQLIAQSLPAFLAGHSASRNEALEFPIYNSIALQIFTVACIVGLCYLTYWGYKNKKSIAALLSFSLVLIIFSFTIFLHTIIRANANPPMNENEPKKMTKLATYISREQYGSAPMWPRRYQTEDMYVYYHNKKDDNGNYVYGEWNPPGRIPVTRKDGSQIGGNDWNNVNTAGELNYLWKYQINQMYIRYFLWNFVGRTSDVQDAGVAWFNVKDAKDANYKTGNFGLFPVRYFALPLLFGLFGVFYHFKRNPKMALTFLATFLVMGVLTAIYQNQQEPQPRERDYFYVGSFLVWGLWMAIGTYALIDTLKSKSTALVTLVLIVSFMLVPFNLAYSNVKIYGRDGKFLPFDYAYNVLQSVEQDAILFTNGDNDTFPVWYMQDVEGVRRDVRVCNLSLGNTLWYIDQLKNRNPWGAKKVPISFPDDSIRVNDEYEDASLSYDFGPAKTDQITVSKEILSKFTNDPNIINAGAVTITFIGKEMRKDEKGNPLYLHRVQDKLVRDIIIQNRFERPLYFVSSAGTDARCGLEGYLRTEGLCHRICPVPQEKVNGNDAFSEEVMDKILFNIDNSENISKTPKYGLKLRNLNNKDVCYDETDRRTVLMAYPGMFIGYATYLAEVKKDFKRAEKVMDTYLKYIPLDKIPLTLDAEYRIANIYELCGNKAKTDKYARFAIKTCEEQIANENLSPETIQYEQLGRYYGPYQFASDLYKMTGQWDKAKTILEQLVVRMQSYVQQMQAMGSNEEASNLAARAFMIKLKADQLAIDKFEQENKYNEALAEIQKIEETLMKSEDPYAPYFLSAITARKNEIEAKLGIKKSMPDSAIAMKKQ